MIIGKLIIFLFALKGAIDTGLWLGRKSVRLGKAIDQLIYERKIRILAERNKSLNH